MKNALDTTFDHKDPYRILGVTLIRLRAPSIRPTWSWPSGTTRTSLPPTRRSTAPRRCLMQDIKCGLRTAQRPAPTATLGPQATWARSGGLAAGRATGGPGAERAPRVRAGAPRHPKVQRVRESLRTAAERQEAAHNIRKFQTSREGSAYIPRWSQVTTRMSSTCSTATREPDSRITMFDDGLVEMMLLYEGALRRSSPARSSSPTPLPPSREPG